MSPHLTNRLALVATCVAGLLLSGCATLNEQECRSADWRAIGRTPEREAMAERYLKEFSFTTFVDRWHELYRNLAHAR